MLFFKRILPLAFFLLTSLPHHPVSDLLDRYLIDPFGIAAVQSGAAVLSIVVFGFFLGLLWKSLKAVESPRTAVVLLWLVTLALVFLSDWLLIVNNIERIHFPQYAILAVLLRLSLVNDVLILSLCSLAGGLDEFLQYLMNPVRTNYLDFNDIVLNMIGAAVGILLAASFKRPSREIRDRYESKFRSVFFSTVAVSVLVCLLAVASGRVVTYGDPVDPPRPIVEQDGKRTLVLSFKKPEAFWVDAGLGRRFHILSPVDGISVIGGLVVCYGVMFAWIRRDAGKMEK